MPLDDIEYQSWLEADLTNDLPKYDWGEAGIPSMKPVEYFAGIGLVVKAGEYLPIVDGVKRVLDL